MVPLCRTIDEPPIPSGKFGSCLVPKSPVKTLTEDLLPAIIMQETFSENEKTFMSNIYNFDPAKFYNSFDFKILLRASSMMLQLSMISFQRLQVNLALRRLLMSNHSRIFSNISAGRSSLINGKFITFSSALLIFDALSPIFVDVTHCDAK